MGSARSFYVIIVSASIVRRIKFVSLCHHLRGAFSALQSEFKDEITIVGCHLRGHAQRRSHGASEQHQPAWFGRQPERHVSDANDAYNSTLTTLNKLHIIKIQYDR
jgi:hypothetical protein